MLQRTGIGSGDTLYFTNGAFDCAAQKTTIQALVATGATVLHVLPSLRRRVAR